MSYKLLGKLGPFNPADSHCFHRSALQLLTLLLSFCMPLLMGAQQFKSSTRVPTAGLTGAIVASDVNGDGLADLFLLDATSGSMVVHVLLAQPAGSWTAAANLSFPGPVTLFGDCLLVDVNADKKLDLVCTESYTFTIYVRVRLGNGDGTFQALVDTVVPSPSNGGWAESAIEVLGDVDSDGFADVYQYEGQGLTAHFLLSDGKGGFKAQLPAQYSSSVAPITADVNGDGIPDLLYPGGPVVALGTGGGLFGSAVSYGSLNNVIPSCVFHDMDADGHLDAICGYIDAHKGATGLLILHGNPDGSFNKTPIAQKRFGDYDTEYDGFGTFRYPVAIADLNGDGILDVIGISGDGIAVLLGGANLSFSTPLHYVLASSSSGGLYYNTQYSVADMNGDGLPDFVSNSQNGVYIAYAQKDGAYSSAFAPEVAEVIGYPTMADFNGDGIPDIAATGDTAIKLSLGKGDGTYAAPVALPNQSGKINFDTPLSEMDAHIVHGDFDGDGKLDLIAIGSSGIYQYDDYVLFGTGPGTFSDPKLVPNTSTSWPGRVPLIDSAVADLNKDGRSDLVWLKTSTSSVIGSIDVSVSNGDGTFKTVSSAIPVDTSGISSFASLPALFDMDGDGNLDAVYGSYFNVYVARGRGDATFDSNTTVLAFPTVSAYLNVGAVSVTAGDFDGDGNMDIAALASYSGTGSVQIVWVYYGDGKGSFSAPEQAERVAESYTTITAARLGHTGRSDLILNSSGTLAGGNAVGVLLSQPGRSFAAEVNYPAGTGLSALMVGDVNRDGWLDLIFGNGDYNITASSVTELISLGDTTQVSGTLVATPEPSIVTSSFTITATLIPSLTGTLSGNITFSVDGTPVGLVPLSGNQAKLQVAGSYAIGSHSLTASWPGDATYGAVSLTGQHQIAPAPTTTTINTSQTPAMVGNSVTFTVAVSSAHGAPTGSVQLLEGSTLLATLPLVNGRASYQTSSLAVGTHILTATYPATGNFASSSATVNEQINGLPSTTVLIAAPNPVYVQSAVTLTAFVSPVSGAAGSQVSFYDAGTLLGSATVDSIGNAQLVTSFTTAGAHPLTAVFSGSSTINSSTSAVYSEQIQLIPTVTAVMAIPTPGTALQPITFSATVTALNLSTPTGTVTFFANGAAIGSAQLQSNSAHFTTSTLGAGNYQITASYTADATHSASTSPAYGLLVLDQTSQATLTSSSNPSTYGTPVTFTAQVTAPAGIPSGTVLFRDAATTLSAAVPLDAQGKATFTTSTLALGTHSVRAIYSGDVNTLATISSPVAQTVLAYSGDFTLNVTPATAKIYTGESATFRVQAISSGGFDRPLALTCSGVPANTTCKLSSTTIANGQGASTLTIATAAPHPLSASSGAGRTVFPALLSAGVLWLLFPARFRRRAGRLLLLALAMLFSITACSAPAPITGGTTPGSYKVSITATYSVPGSVLTHSAVIDLTVKSLF